MSHDNAIVITGVMARLIHRLIVLDRPIPSYNITKYYKDIACISECVHVFAIVIPFQSLSWVSIESLLCGTIDPPSMALALAGLMTMPVLCMCTSHESSHD